MGDSSPKDDDVGGAVLLMLALVAVGVFLILPTILALVAFLTLHSRLRHREFGAILIVGVAGWVVAYRHLGVTYFEWVRGVVTEQQFVAGFPVIAILLTTCILLGALGLLGATRISERLPGAFRDKVTTERETILPSAAQRAKVSSVVTAPGTLTVTPSARAAAAAAEVPGKRRFPIAIGPDGTPVTLGEDEIRTHTMILGATGSGKSEAIKVLAGALMDMGWSGMLLDLKEDTAQGGLRDWACTYAQYHTTPYQELRLSDANSATWFNPLFGMGPDEVRDTILTLQEFDDAYWQALNKELLGQVVNLAVWAHQCDPVQFPAPTMFDLGKMMSSGDLRTATKRMRAAVLSSVPGVTKDDFRTLENPSPEMQKSATGYGSKLTLIYDTQAGRTVLRPGMSNERALIDVTAPGLTYVGLDSQGKADLTKVISSAVLQRMSVYAAQRTTGQVEAGVVQPRFLIVDEANWVDRTIVQNLLSRARSAGIAMVLCTQGPKDWIDKQGDDWGKLTQNVNCAVIMSQGEPESAELCADYIGHVYKKQRSETVKQQRGLLFNKVARDVRTGDVLESHVIREELAHLIDPDDLRRMGVGDAILRVGKPAERVTWMHIVMRNPKSGPASVG